MAEIVFQPIGQVKAQFTEGDVRGESKELEGELEIYLRVEPALGGARRLFASLRAGVLQPAEHDRIGPLQVKPRRLVNKGFNWKNFRCLASSLWIRPRDPIPSGSRSCASSVGRDVFSKSAGSIFSTARRFSTSKVTGRLTGSMNSPSPIGTKSCRTHAGIFEKIC